MLGAKTVAEAMEDFITDRAAEGRQPSTLVTTRHRLAGILRPVMGLPVKDLGTPRCELLYTEYQKGRAVDTHQGALSQAKAMFEFIRKRLKLRADNPWTDVDPRGTKNRGKAQLKEDDTAKLYWWLVEHLEDDRALGAFMALVLGLRSHEVVGRTGDHLDAGGTKLMVTKSKTKAGIRSVRLPEVLQVALRKRSELRSGRLLPYTRYWVRDATKWCCEGAGVPVVCAQALRGMYTSALLEDGIDPERVALSIGHGKGSGTAVVVNNYAAQGAGRSVKTARVVERLSGKQPTTRTDFTGLPN
jgi:integrase